MKNLENQKIFYKFTEDNKDFLNCINEEGSVEDQCKSFTKVLDRAMHACFQKVRIKKDYTRVSSNNKVCAEVYKLFQEKSKLKHLQSLKSCMSERQLIDVDISKLDERISSILAQKNARIIGENTSNLENTEGNFSQLSMWKLKGVCFYP